MRRPGEERGAGARGRERRRHRGGARVTWDVIRGPQDLIMGRRMEEDWSGRETQEGNASLVEGTEDGNGNRGVQERGCAETTGGCVELIGGSAETIEGSAEVIGGSAEMVGGSAEMVGGSAERCTSHYVIGAQQAHLTLTRSHTDGDKYWGRGKSFPQEVTSGSQGSVAERSPQSMVHGDWGDRGPGGREQGPVDATSDPQQCEASGGGDLGKERMEMSERGSHDAQGLQRRKKKSKSSKEKKRGKADGRGGAQQHMEDSSFQDLYRGHSLEEEEALLEGEGVVGEDSQCALSSNGGSEVKEQRQEINGNKGRSMGIEGRGSREGLLFSKELRDSLGGMKGFSQEVPEGSKHYEECPQSDATYRDVFRSPGNGCSGSAERLEMQQGNPYSGEPCRGLGRCEREWDGEMEEKSSDPINYQHLQFVAQNCSSSAYPMASGAQPSLEGCGTVKETGTWCWCLHLYLGDSEVAPRVEGEATDEGQARECGYSVSSTLRVGENLDERSGGGVNLGDIPEPITKKGGKMGETPELQEWVNWWQGWAGSCRAGSGRRRGKSAPAWGCRGEARGEGQKQQDVWVLREWTRRDGGKRGENGPRVPGGEVWVLREQEGGKQDSAWPLGTEDVWVPREPRKQRSAYFMADNAKWTPRSAKPGVSDKGEP